MENVNLFEKAVRTKMRFPFKGMVSVEDLWDLNVKDLDSIFQALNSRLKQSKEESLLNRKTPQDEELELKIEIIKHIVQVKVEEENLKVKEKEQKEEKQKILSILHSKQDEELHNKSPEELKQMLEELEG